MKTRNNYISYIVILVLILDWYTPQTMAKLVQLHGVGASFPGEIYSRWISSYKQHRGSHVTLNMTYHSTGSGTGKQTIMGYIQHSPPVSYAGSDIPLLPAEQGRHPDLRAFPVMAGEIVIAFNIKNVNSLNLTIETITGIYNGSIHYWNDLRIQVLNPKHRLPNTAINVIARSDTSGTTYAFTSSLARYSTTWNNEYGTFAEGLDNNDVPIKWNASVIQYYGFSNRGMSGLILSIRNSIGYTTVGDLYRSKLQYALVQNTAGNFVSPHIETVKSVLVYEKADNSSNASGPNAYPFIASTYFIIAMTHTHHCDSIVELIRYIEWFYTSKTAKRESEELFMSTLSEEFSSSVIQNILKGITCGDQNVWRLVLEQKTLELQPEDEFRPLYVVLAVLGSIVIVGVILIGRQQWVKYKEIANDSWLIDYAEIQRDSEDLVEACSLRSTIALETVSSVRQVMYIDHAWETTDIKLGYFKTEIVILIKSDSEIKTSKFHIKKMLVWFRNSVDHPNISKFVGLTKSNLQWFSIYKGQTRGSVIDVIHDTKIKTTTAGMIVICKEIIRGMEYLHKRAIIHGNLRGSCCMLDSHWTVKITNWHTEKLKLSDQFLKCAIYDYKNMKSEDDIIPLYWIAPELIKFGRRPTYEADVYSFGIVMHEIFSKVQPYSEFQLPPKEIISAILQAYMRPKFSEHTPALLRTIMERTWEIDPAARPRFSVLRQIMNESFKENNSLTDCMMKSIEDYALSLQVELQEARKEMDAAKEFTKSLLLDNAPGYVVERCLNNLQQESCKYIAGTILTATIANLKHYVNLFSASEVVATLDDFMTGVDQTLLSTQTHKLTINGMFVLFSSDPNSRSLNQVRTISTSALMLMGFLERFIVKRPVPYMLRMKIGIATGPMLVGVLGEKHPKYTMVGEAADEAFVLLLKAREGTIRVSKVTYEMLKQCDCNFGMCVLQDNTKDMGDSSYWLVSQQGIQGRFDPRTSL